MLPKVSTMPSSPMPIERPYCSRCRTRMNLSRVSPAPDRKEKRVFECPKCKFMNTVTVPDPLEQLVRDLGIQLRELE
jgi:transposase-like protein